jgi:hypothetical protein
MSKKATIRLGKETIFLDDTCAICGRKNLTPEEVEIIFDEKGDGYITVCLSCGIGEVMSKFKQYLKPGREKQLEKSLEKTAKKADYNYNRRLMRRVLGGDKNGKD